jgi:hypothetical protein
MFLAVPAQIRMALSMLLAFRSGILVVAISCEKRTTVGRRRGSVWDEDDSGAEGE